MTKKEQEEFVVDICDALKVLVLTKVPNMPETWDGYELRLYIADKAQELTRLEMSRKRMRDYNNTVIVSNL